MPTVEELLRNALRDRRAKPLQAVEDLKAIATEVATAVSNVTNDKIKVVLEPLKPKELVGPTLALAVRIEDEPRVLRVFALAELGYPILFYFNIESWDRNAPRGQLSTTEELRSHVLGLLAGPQSELVRIIDNYLASQPDG